MSVDRLFNASLAFAVATLCLLSAARAGELTLVDEGKSDYQIVLPDEPTLVQQTAAKELQSYLQRATGAELPIVAASDVAGVDDAKLLILGPGVLSQRTPGIDESAIKTDGIVVKVVGDDVVLTGAPERGTLYAVYEFLEREVGIRWLSSTVEFVPEVPTLTIDDGLSIDYAPKLVYRESFYRDAFSNPFAARIKCNGDSSRLTDEYGGKCVFALGCHSSFALIPPKVYFQDHPDWFAEIDGVRCVGAPFCWGMEDVLGPGQARERGTQLCFSNDEMIEELIKNAREELRNNPGAKFIDISQEDCEGYCQCEKCRAIDEEEGAHSGSLLRAVNKVAEALEEEFPDVYVETLAYRYTRKPPKITKPRHNVVVRLCSIECSFGQPLDAEINADFHDDLIKWSEISDNLFVWDYATDFGYYILPFPNYRVLRPNIRFYVDHKVLGMLEQGDYQMPTGDFVELRAWIVAKLLWNPDADVRELFDDFVSHYYAPELIPIYWDYFNLLSDAVERDNFKLDIYLMTTKGWLDAETLTKCTALQNQAAEIAERLEKESPERYAGLIDRVRRGRLPLDAVWAQEYRRMLVETRLRGMEFLGPKDPVQAAKDFLQKLDDWGFVKHRESDPGDFYPKFRKETLEEYAGWRTPFASKPGVCENVADSSWIDVQEYEFEHWSQGPTIEENADASNGYEVKLSPDQRGKWFLPEQERLLQPKDGKDDVYVYVRGAEGSRVKFGLEEEELGVAEVSSEFAPLKLGTLELDKGSVLWIEPLDGDVFVDRFAIVCP
ncbi:MAG: DUF4838 domain-containing protein [Thermoguttaceae bacterium]|nr:DUF4838 domain-containing protein [Thermoguttaceae bacterium]